MSRVFRLLTGGALVLALAACGSGGPFSKLKGDGSKPDLAPPRDEAYQSNGRLFDLFRKGADANVTVAVNKYIWNATLDVLSFLPVEAADPFSGVIVMGWGTAPGTNRSYRATVYIQDPALDARSLRVALVSRGGPASRDTVRQIEDAILTRARQMRIADSKL